jgi:phage-related protein
VTGKDMATVMGLIGKAANGTTRGLAALIGPIEKGATVTDILKQANEKFLPVAEELADSVGGKLLTAQIEFGEQMDALGGRFIPAVTDALGFLTTNVLPITEELMTTLGDVIFDAGAKLTEKGGFVDSVLAVVGPIGEKLSPKIQELADNVGKLLGKVGDLVVALWDDGKGPLAIAVSAIGGAFEVLLGIINGVIEVITFLINLATEAIKLLDRLGGTARGQAAFPTFTGGGGNYGGGGGGQQGMSPYPTGPIGANIVIGTNSLDSIDLYLGQQARVSTGRTIPGRE